MRLQSIRRQKPWRAAYRSTPNLRCPSVKLGRKSSGTRPKWLGSRKFNSHSWRYLAPPVYEWEDISTLLHRRCHFRFWDGGRGLIVQPDISSRRMHAREIRNGKQGAIGDAGPVALVSGTLAGAGNSLNAKPVDKTPNRSVNCAYVLGAPVVAHQLRTG